MSPTGRATPARWDRPAYRSGPPAGILPPRMGGARARAAATVAVVALSALAATVAGPAVGAATTTTPAPSSTSRPRTTAPPTTTVAPTTTIAPVPAVPAPPGPGGSVGWAPQGRAVLGRPLLYTGSAGGAFVAWMDPQLARPVVVPGSADPGGPGRGAVRSHPRAGRSCSRRSTAASSGATSPAACSRSAARSAGSPAVRRR